MESGDRLSFHQNANPSGIGCALIFPAALFGTLMLADYAGPQGWRGFAEFIGWWSVCIALSVVCEALVRRFRQNGQRRLLPLIAAIVIGLGLLVFTILEAQPETPAMLKLTYTTMLQFFGVAGVMALAGFFAWLGINSRKR